MKKRVFALICALALCLPLNAFAAGQTSLDRALTRTAKHCLTSVPSPEHGAEWLVIALARGDHKLPSGYLASYYAAMEACVSACKGVLSRTKYTEYSRAVLAVTAAGYDASQVAGYDLTEPLGDYDAVKRQGLNGPIFALLALDSGNYPCDTRDNYVDYILSRQLEDGGWAFSGAASDTDMTAMALQALAKYTHRTDVAAAVEQGVDRLSSLQNKDGSYGSYGTVNAESTAQVILALCELGISLDDSRFLKGGATLLEGLLSYQNTDGSFHHTNDGSQDGVATEQAFLALVSAARQRDGLSGIYSMDSSSTLTDISGHWAERGIRYCVNAGLFQGTPEGKFSPETAMSRSMLMTVLWRMAGSPTPSKSSAFSDVAKGAYYSDAVAWAAGAGITDGYSDGSFGVNDRVTRQQMALFLYRYAKYRGADVSGRADLSGYADAGEIASWAKQAMSWANKEGILTGTSGNKLLPNGSATRGQVAVILMRFVEGLK